MNTRDAKKLIKGELGKLGRANRVTARTHSVEGKGYVFVQVHDWTPHPDANLLMNIGRKNGFGVEFSALNGFGAQISMS